MLIAFNELSMQVQDNLSVASSQIRGLVRLGAALRKEDVGVLFPVNFCNQRIYERYTVQDWLQDKRASRDIKNRLRILITKHGNLETHLGELSGYECLFEEQTSSGLLFAACRNRFSAGMASEGWKRNSIDVTLRAMDDDCNISEVKIKIANIWDENGAKGAGERISQSECANFSVRHGEDLIRLIDRYRDCIAVGTKARKGLSAMRGTEITFSAVVEAVKMMVIRAISWSRAPDTRFEDGLGLRASDESEATMNSYGDARKFPDEEGTKITCSWHIKLGPQAWRIHYVVRAPQRSVLIGYVGEHLRTVSDPT